MEFKLKPVVAVVAVGAFLNLTTPGRAFALWCSADASMVYQNLLTRFIPFVINGITGIGLGAEEAVVQSGAAVRGEVLKTATAEIKTAEAVEAYEQQQQLKRDLQDVSEALRPPAQTCTTVAAASSIGSAIGTAQRSAFVATSVNSNKTSAAATPSTVAAMDSAFNLSNSKFCSDTDRAILGCKPASGAYSALAGADRDAAFLFQSPDGSLSYAGDGKAQDEAAASYIERVVAGIPVQALLPTDKSFYSSSPQARSYVEVARRYNAMLSMSRYSLNSIRAAGQVQPGLGDAMMLSNIPVSGYAPNKSDMSISEAVDRFVAMKFSPATVQDLSTATKSTTILRDMSQASAFQLWLSFQAQQRSLRTEGLMAHQLTLLADQVLRPQLDAQRKTAAEGRAVAP